MTQFMRIARFRSVSVLCAALFAAIVSAPTLALWQDKQNPPAGKSSEQKTANSDKKKKKTDDAGNTDQRNGGKRNRRSRGDAAAQPKTETTTRSIPAGKPNALNVVPMSNGQEKGAIRVEKGPDGKPIILGPDGKPITPGPGGQAVIGAPTRIEIPGGPGGGPGFGGKGSPGGGNGGFPSFSPGGMISMDYRGSDINNVLKFFAMATGWQIVPDATLSGPVTIISPKQLTIDQAFQVLQSVLQIRGFSGQLETHGRTQVLKIVPLDRASQAVSVVKGTAIDPKTGRPLPGLTDPGKTADDLKGQVITEVIPIENVDANALSRELAPLINKGASIVASTGTNALIVTDTASNVDRVKLLVEMLDKAASNNTIEMIALHHSDATEIANSINSLFRQVFGRGRGGGFGGQGGQGGNPGGGAVTFQGGPPGQPPGAPGQPGGAPGGDPARAAVVAVPDTRTNSVLVIASKENMERVKELVNKLDSAETTALETYTRKLKYADAFDVADTINSVLSGSVPTRGGQQGNNFNQRVFGGGGFGGGFGGFGGFGGGGGQQGSVQSTDPFAKVVPNARTNSLYITATKEKMERIDELIRELDVEVPVETTTFVVPLKNAQAQDMATSLSQAFGTQSGGGFGGGFGGFGGFNIFGNQNRQPQQRQPINRRQTGGQTGGGFGRSAPIYPTQTMMQGPDGQTIHGTMTPNGFVPDAQAQEDSVTRGQFFFPGGGFGGRQQQPTPSFGRGQGGGVVNLLQLRQNVGVVPDLGSNSLIITTTPDNMRAIQQIIESLDIVPRQVMIEVIIAEATLDTTQKLGFQFDAKGVGKFLGTAINQAGSSAFPLGNAGTTSGNIASPITQGAQYGVQAVNGSFNGLIQALATDNRVHILSTPKIFTSNNMQAQIDVTQNIPIVSASAGFGFGTTNSLTQLPVGITVNVTPRITKDGLVTMDILASDTELLGFDTLQTGTDANGRPIFATGPRTSERSTDTSVSARDGEVIVLGGLMRDNKTVSTNKVPLLGDIPLLGALFRSRTTSVTKTELMIFLIPHVVDGDAQNRAMVQEQAKKIMKDVPELKKQYPSLDPDKAKALPGAIDRGAPKPETDRKPDNGKKPETGQKRE